MSYAASILIIILCSCALALSFAPVLIKPSMQHGQFKYSIISLTDAFGSLYGILFCILCLLLIRKQKYLVSVGAVTLLQHRIRNFDSSVNHDHSDDRGKKSSVQITLFGVGSFAYAICYILNVASRHRISIVRSTNNGILLGCIILIIVFLHRYNGAYLKGCHLFQYSIAFMIGAEAWAWIFITVKPLWTLSVNISSLTPNVSGRVDNKLHPNFETVTEVIATFLQPFFVEFLSITVGCLLALWKTMSKDSLLGTENEESYNARNRNSRQSLCQEQNGHIQDYGTLLEAEYLIQRRNSEETRTSKIHKYLGFAFSCLIGLGYFSASQILIVGPFSGISSNLPDTTRSIIITIVQAVVYLPLFVAVVISIHTFQGHSNTTETIRQFTTSDYLLLFTSAANVAFYSLKTIGVVGLFYVESEFTTLTITFYLIVNLCCILYTWTQTQFIMTAKYVHRSGHKLPRLVDLTLPYLIVDNLVDWLNLSIDHQWIEKYSLDLGTESTEFITTYIGPIYKMLHSA